MASFISDHKILVTVSVFLVVIIAGVAWFRGYYISKLKPIPDIANDYSPYYIAPSPTSNPESLSPSGSPMPSDDSVLGSSDVPVSNNDGSTGKLAPVTNQAALSADIPEATTAPAIDCIGPDGKHLKITQDACDNFNRAWATPTPTFPPISYSSDHSNPENSNCSTGAGVPNSWYSDVYPNPPVSTNTGSVTLIVNIRDCNESNAPVSDKLNITLSSGDPNTQINGNNLPYIITTQNGEASFSISSQDTGTVTLVIQDTTSSFTITDVNNNNPKVTFYNSPSPTSQPTPIQINTQSPTPTPSKTQSPAPTTTPTPNPTPVITSTLTSTPTP